MVGKFHLRIPPYGCLRAKTAARWFIWLSVSYSGGNWRVFGRWFNTMFRYERALEYGDHEFVMWSRVSNALFIRHLPL